MKRGLVVAFAVIGFLGFLDSTFLALEHFLNRVPPCGLSGCETVTTSAYSVVLGIPVALLGVIYYFSMFAVSVYVLQKNDAATFKILSWVTSAGLLASLWFVFAQAFILHSYCLYCLFSALTSTALFVLGMVNLKSQSKMIV